MQLVVTHRVVESVGTEQKAIADRDLDLSEVRIDLVASANHVRQHVPHWMLRQLVAGEPLRSQGGRPRVILRDLAELSRRRQPIQPAVAYVADNRVISVDDETDKGGTHAGGIVVAFRRSEHTAFREVTR